MLYNGYFLRKNLDGIGKMYDLCSVNNHKIQKNEDQQSFHRFNY